MDRDYGQRLVGISPALAAQYGDDDYFVFRVRQLENGYTFNSKGWQARYVPDIPGILREVALKLGGPEAVPVEQVSPEEAGLLDEPSLFSFGTDGPDKAVQDLVETYRKYMYDTRPIPSWVITERIDAIFKVFGYADYHDYCTRKVGSVDQDNKILAILGTLVNEPEAPVNEDERKSND